MTRLALPVLAPMALLLASAAPAGPPRFGLPVACEPGRTCELQHYVDRDPGPGAKDYRCGLQSYQAHTGVDFRLPDMAAMRRGVAVVAAAPGTVRYIRDGVPDQPPGRATGPQNGCGNGVSIDHGGGWLTVYCHMANGSIAVAPGQAVVAGQRLGRIGITGNSDFPHLHFDVRQGDRVIDPFAPDMAAACPAGRSGPMWTAAAAAKLAYRQGVVLNAGFTDAQPSAEDVEAATVRPFAGAASPWMIFYVRAIGLLPGDEAELELKAPDGAVLATVRRPPLARWRAQDFNLIGKRRPAAGWPKGVYVADYRVWRSGKVAVSRRLQVRL
ncbi:MAG: M23 family metallopeptidase [Phenylobacterium sp.]|uniref:M23 family metallopeptidase n=1 Tax=Phenylobacterium sp. TaxID=1871053 RepID=UPI001A5B8FFF|nr:M23 family metallopeptidase [Phenylobacterium sp.]MBL8772022.1 M23 family metallopeptidase [Phenylobacterium sp.]